ncbi:MAG: hypothetical protein EI684_03390 [Candidatus Viridilinea halotolerans]|uniref:Uncharacterized protein n=1 Tax=Candidatus Viridilinea halotolerans TaxID=2491704 RepID=A0A426U818_9CHLR|nr:MAG: hypothetical protein EI684_03390 [Candidatus Viridilinea halotolerans]
MALRAYVPERMTLDVDILIHADDEPAAHAAFSVAGYHITGPLSIGGFTAHASAATAPIDVITSSAPWLEEALTTPTYDVVGFPVMPRPYLLLLKLQAGRSQDLADIQRLLRGTSVEERSHMRTIIANADLDLVEDFEALCTLADLEYGS